MTPWSFVRIGPGRCGLNYVSQSCIREIDMQSTGVPAISSDNFRMQSTFLITLTSVVVLIPFTLNNFLQNRPLIGLGALAVIVITALNSLEAKRGNSRPALIVFAMAPCMVTFLLLSLYKQGLVATYWIFPVIISYYCMLDVKRAQIVNGLTLLCLLPPIWNILDPEIATRVTATTLAVSIFSAISASISTRYHRALESRVITDPLTGLLNRTLLNDTLNSAIGQFKRQQTPMTVLLLDLDDFKAINDTDGHEVGDSVLVSVGDIIKQSTRISDSCFRLGGEEILCLLYGADYTNGRNVAERIRRKIATTTFRASKPTTTSIGVSTLMPDDDWQSWVSRADKKLYEAKKSGKNRVV